MKNCCVVIVTYNAENWIDVCLKPFKDVDDKDISVIVIDNASSDKTVENIQKKYSFVKLVTNSQNLGFGKANNIGIKYAYDNGFRHVFLLNQDAEISVENLYKICELQDNNPDYYCLSPVHYNKDKKIDSLFNKNMVESGIDNIEEIDKTICDIKFCNAALWCLSRSCIEEIGGFSPSFFHYGEDNNYVDRIHYYSKKIGVVPSIKASHYRENPRSQNTFFTDKYKTNYRYMLQNLSNPNINDKYMYFKFYRKLVFKLFFAVLTIDFGRIKRNFKLISSLSKNHKNINKNKELSKQHIKLCFL